MVCLWKKLKLICFNEGFLVSTRVSWFLALARISVKSEISAKLKNPTVFWWGCSNHRAVCLSILNPGGNQEIGVSALKHVEPVCRSEVFCVNSLLIIMASGNSRCYRSAIVASGRDLHPAVTATYNPVLLRQTGQSGSGARQVTFSFTSQTNSGVWPFTLKTLRSCAIEITINHRHRQLADVAGIKTSLAQIHLQSHTTKQFFPSYLILLTFFFIFALQCSVTCEKGVKQRVVTCVDIKNTSVKESFCNHNPKPPTTESCFAGSCKTDWVVSHKWSQVSTLRMRICNTTLTWNILLTQTALESRNDTNGKKTSK